MNNNTSDSNEKENANVAADLVRQKLNEIYNQEPNAKEELQETESITSHRSKHQNFMHELSKSGRSLAEIQTAWHEYYTKLPDNEKHQVWQEFYQEHNLRSKKHPSHTTTPHDSPLISHKPILNEQTPQNTYRKIKTPRSNRSTKKAGQLKSLMFGLASGGVVLLILLFGFFNERFIAPFISPSKRVSSSAIIIDPVKTDVGPESKLIIPKINVELPIDFTQESIDEKAIQSALENGVVHYATTSNPGELGNGALFGHSSSNILNRGKYKYAFVLLNLLKPGDVFYVQKDSKRYVYKIIDTKIVKPDEVGVLNETGGKPSTFSLITCDPPGTSINRLVVLGEQISPDPATNSKSTAQLANSQPEILPSNSISLWSRIWNWIRS